MDTTVEIIPAIMPDDYDELVSSATLVLRKVNWVQIDVMDGKYTNSISWPYGKHGEHFENILKEDEGLPFWQELNYELDLMVSDPYTEALKWARSGVGRIVLHNKTLRKGNPEELIDELKNLGIEVGIAILPDENLEEIKNIVDRVDYVQFMGIEKVGFQNQEFSKGVVTKIVEFNNLYPDKIISVDGGVDSDTAGDLFDAGARRLVSGSYIFEGIPEDRISTLKELCLKN